MPLTWLTISFVAFGVCVLILLIAMLWGWCAERTEHADIRRRLEDMTAAYNEKNRAASARDGIISSLEDKQ
jgi:hypothetical protein